MKQVTFGTATKTKKNYTAHDLRDQVIAFLTAHGMNQTYALEITWRLRYHKGYGCE